MDSPLDVVDGTHKETSIKKEPRSSLLKFSKVPNPTDIEKVSLTSEKKAIFDTLLGQLLENGHISQACQLANQFGQYDQDLSLVVVSFVVFAEYPKTLRPTLGANKLQLFALVFSHVWSWPQVPNTSTSWTCTSSS